MFCVMFYEFPGAVGSIINFCITSKHEKDYFFWPTTDVTFHYDSMSWFKIHAVCFLYAFETSSNVISIYKYFSFLLCVLWM